jgi:hypothetical protein
MPKRYLGNIITDTPTAPAGPFQNDAASGVWSLAEANAYTAAGLWPIPGNVKQDAFFAGGYSGAALTQIDTIDIGTTGNATDFGDLSTAQYVGGCSSSATRAIIGGGDSNSSTILYFTMSSGGATGTFGSLNQSVSSGVAGASNSTRGLMLGGSYFSGNTVYATNIQYVTIASTGNAIDFGDLTLGRNQTTAASNSTRAICSGGNDGSGSNSTNVMDYVTIGTTGNATDFGDLAASTRRQAGAASSTRALFAGGRDSGGPDNGCQYVTIASTGNAANFGNLTITREELGGTSGATRSVFGGGGNGRDTIDFYTTASTGAATDFGDLAQSRDQATQTTSTAHGGLAA